MDETTLILALIAAAVFFIATPEARKADGRPADSQPKEKEDGRI